MVRMVHKNHFDETFLHLGDPQLEVSTKTFCDPAQQWFIGDLAKNALEFDGEIHLQHRKGIGGGGRCSVTLSERTPSLLDAIFFASSLLLE